MKFCNCSITSGDSCTNAVFPSCDRSQLISTRTPWLAHCPVWHSGYLFRDLRQCLKLFVACCRAGTSIENSSRGREDGAHVLEADAFEDSTTAALPRASTQPRGDGDGAQEGAGARSLTPQSQGDQIRVLDGAATQTSGTWSPGDPAPMEDGTVPHRSSTNGEASSHQRPSTHSVQSWWRSAAGRVGATVGVFSGEWAAEPGPRHVQAPGFEGAALSVTDTSETLEQGAGAFKEVGERVVEVVSRAVVEGVWNPSLFAALQSEQMASLLVCWVLLQWYM